MNTYPHDYAFPKNTETQVGGLSIREYFAAMAMQGFCANTNAWNEFTHEQQAIAAVQSADLLIAALNKATGKEEERL